MQGAMQRLRARGWRACARVARGGFAGGRASARTLGLTETLALPKRNPSLALNVARSCSWRCCSTATSFVRLVAPRGGSSRSRPRRRSGRRCAAPALTYSAPAPTQAPTLGRAPAGYQPCRKPRGRRGAAITERTRCSPCSTVRRCAHAQYVHVIPNLPIPE